MAKSVQAGTIYTDIVARTETMDPGLRAGGAKAAKGGREIAAAILRGMDRVGEKLGKRLEDAISKAIPGAVRRAKKGGEDVGDGFDRGLNRGPRSGDQVAERYARMLREGLARKQAAIKEAIKRGLMTPAEAAKAGREAAEAHNRALLAGMERLRIPKSTRNGLVTPMTGRGQKALADALVMNTGPAARDAAGRSGDEVAKRFVSSAKRRMDGEMGKIQAAAASGLLSPREAAKRGKAAGEAYNRALLAAMRKMEARGKLTAGASATFGGSLVDPAKMGNDAAELAKRSSAGASAALQKLGGVAAIVLTGILALVSGVRALFGTLAEAERLIRSTLQLSAAGKLLGVSQRQLNDLAREAREVYRLATADANELTVAVTKLAAKAGDVSKSSELMARALDLGAAQGLSATEVALALDQTLRGLDEGTDRLLQKNPSQVYEEYAAAVGKGVGSLSDLEQKQALVNAIMAAGARVQGSYGQLVDSDLGRWQAFKIRMAEVAATIGTKFLPIAADLGETFERVLAPAIRMLIKWLDRFQSPLERSIARLKELGRTAAEVLPLELRAQMTEKDAEAARLRAEIARARTERRATGGRGFGGERGSSFELANDTRTVYEIREEQRRLDGLASQGRLRGDDEAKYQRNKRILELEERLSATVADRANVETRLISAEALAAKARRVRDLEDELSRTRDLVEQQGESVGMMGRMAGLIRQINDARRDAGMPLVDENGNEIEVVVPITPTPAAPEKVDKSTQSAREQLDGLISSLRTLREFKNAAGEPFRSLDEVPDQLRTAIQAVQSIEDEIRNTRAKIAEAESPERAAALRDYLASLDAMAKSRQEYAQRLRDDMAANGELVSAEALAARKEMDRTTSAFRALRDMGVNTGEPPEALVQMVGTVRQLDEQIRDTRLHMQEMRRQNVAPTEGDNAFLADLERQRDAAKDTLSNIGELRDVIRDLPSNLGELFAGLNTTQGDELTASLQALALQVQTVNRAEEAMWYARRRHGAHSRQARDAEAKLTRVREDARKSVLDLIDAVRSSTMADAAKLRIIAMLRAQVDALAGDVKEVSREWERWGNIASDVASITRSLGELGREMGVLSEKQSEVVNGFADMAEGAATFAAAMAAHNPVGMVQGAIGFLKGAVSAVRGVFGESQAAKEARVAMLTLTEALKSLERTIINDRSSNEVSADVQMVLDAARRLRQDDETFSGYGPTRRGALHDLAKRMGVADQDDDKATSIAKLKLWAEELDRKYGTNLADFIERSDTQGLLAALDKLGAALAAAGQNIGTFADDVAGVMERVKFQLDALGNTNAVDRLRAVVKALQDAGKSAGDFQDELAELATLDLSTEDGRKRRDEIIKSMVDALTAGGANLGDWTADQLRAFILEWAGASGGATDGEGGGVVGEGATNEQHMAVGITTVQANLLLEIGMSQLDELRQIRTAITSGHQLVAPVVPPASVGASPTAPSPSLVSAQGGPIIQFQTLGGIVVQNNFPDGITPADVVPQSEAIGGAIRNGLTGSVRRALRGQGLTGPLTIRINAPGT